MPLDPRPNENGNVWFLERVDEGTHIEGQVGVVGTAAKARLVAARARNGQEPFVWYLSHFATCPERRKRLKK